MDDRRMASRARAAGVLVLCGTLLAGCSAVAARVPAGTGFHLAQISGDRFAEDRSIRVQRVSTAPANGYEWTVAAVDPTSDRLRVDYTDGVCTSADRLAVQETAERVIVGITASKTFEGTCAAVGIPRATTVTLRRPLGGRALMERAPDQDEWLPTVSSPASLPDPTCSILQGSPSDVPVGMPDAATRIAPTAATRAFVCRTWWPRGSAHMESTTITDHAAVAALVTSLNTGSTALHPAADPAAPCPRRLPGSWYDVYLEGPGVRVEVEADEINCLTITNGAASGTIAPALAKALDPLFPH